MAQFLLLDKDRRAVNVIDWDGVTEFIMPECASGFVRYDGPFNSGWLWTGTELIRPDAPPVGLTTE